NGYLENDRANDALRLAMAWTLDYPEDWMGHLSVGRAFQLKMSFDRAITSFEKVLELKPDNPRARRWLAQALAFNREFERAMHHWQTHLEHYPDDLEALVGLAKCQYSLGNIEDAQVTLDRVLRQEDDYVPALLA